MKEVTHMKRVALYLLASLLLNAHAADIKNIPSFDNTDEVVNQFPVEKALLNIYNKERIDILSVIIEGEPTVIETKVIPTGTTIFNNQRVQSASTSHVIKSAKPANIEKVADSKITSIYYFTLKPLKFYGFTNSLKDYAITTQTANIPKVASIGDSSDFAIDNIYTDSSQKTRISTYTKTWALSRASNSTAWLCIDTSADLLSDDPNNTTSNCYSMNTQGELLGNKASYSYSTAEGIKTISYGSER